jgi:hypothetical protein
VPQDAADPNCPCIRRTETPKVDADPLAQNPDPSLTFTQVDHLLPPAQAGVDLFTFFDKNGNQVPVTGGVDISTGQSTIDRIQTVKINLNLFSAAVNPASNAAQRISLSVAGHLNNY